MIDKDPNNWKYRLEFSEKQQSFHMELLDKSVGSHDANTFGWKTVIESGEDAYLSHFIDYIEWRYENKVITMNILEKEKRAYDFIVKITLHSHTRSQN